MGKIIAGVIAVAVIALAIWYFTSKTDDNASSSTDNTKIENTGETNQPNPGMTGATGASPLSLKPGQELQVDVPYKTANGDYYLMFQADGNVVVKTTSGDSFRWGSMQAGAGMEEIPSRVVLQEDGNFVLYDANDKFIWGTMSTIPASQLAITNNGKLQVVSPNGTVVWESKD